MSNGKCVEGNKNIKHDNSVNNIQHAIFCQGLGNRAKRVHSMKQPKHKQKKTRETASDGKTKITAKTLMM